MAVAVVHGYWIPPHGQLAPWSVPQTPRCPHAKSASTKVSTSKITRCRKVPTFQKGAYENHMKTMGKWWFNGDLMGETIGRLKTMGKW